MRQYIRLNNHGSKTNEQYTAAKLDSHGAAYVAPAEDHLVLPHVGTLFCGFGNVAVGETVRPGGKLSDERALEGLV